MVVRRKASTGEAATGKGKPGTPKPTPEGKKPFPQDYTQHRSIVYMSSEPWPDPTQVLTEHTEKFIAVLTALTQEYGIALHGGSDEYEGVYLDTFGSKTVTDFRGQKTTVQFRDIKTPAPLGIEWSQKLGVYITEQEAQVLERIDAKVKAQVRVDHDVSFGEVKDVTT